MVLVLVVLFGSLFFFSGVWRLVSLPLFPPLCLSSSFFARFPSFPFDSSGLDWSGFSGLSLSFFSPLLLSPFLICWFCALLPLCHPWCCAWSFWPQTGPDFQRHPLPPPSPLFLTSLFPYFVSRWDLSFSVIFLAADWSGVSHCWLSCPYFPPLNQARSLAADWSGALLLILYHGTPPTDNKQSRHGLNLTLMRSSMIC